MAWKYAGLRPATAWSSRNARTVSGRYDLCDIVEDMGVPQKSLASRLRRGTCGRKSLLSTIAVISSKTNSQLKAFQYTIVHNKSRPLYTRPRLSSRIEPPPPPPASSLLDVLLELLLEVVWWVFLAYIVLLLLT